MRSGDDHISYLDFVRGMSALAVFFSHAAILGGGPKSFTGILGSNAVSAFMFASGFLMCYQGAYSGIYENFDTRRGWLAFYIRRFFRISPVYYVMLLGAYLLSHHLGECRAGIEGVLPGSGSSPERYFIPGYAANAILHVTYLFGFLPKYAMSNPLPDWSIGLEMQFYLVFPLLYAGMKRRFALTILGGLGIFLAGTGLVKIAGIHYPMPTLLPLEFHNFAAGIVCAQLYFAGLNLSRGLLLCLVTTCVLVLERNVYMPVFVVLSGLYLCGGITKSRFEGAMRKKFNGLCASTPVRFWADISYSLYLIHLLIMIPFMAHAITLPNPLFNPTTNLFTWCAVSLTLLAVASVPAWVVFKVVERPGIAWGKRIIEKYIKRRPADVDQGMPPGIVKTTPRNRDGE